MSKEPRPDPAARQAAGRSLRQRVPRSAHESWSAADRKVDAIDLLEAQNVDRLQWLVPLRRARMLASPFAFYRGAAAVMAADLAATPVTGIEVQACGDAHLANFGFYASPERRLVFDLNDFDETLPGPWEWDVKRLAASFTIAARHNGIGRDKAASITRRAVRCYREAMAQLADMRTTDVWYFHLREEHALRVAEDEGRGKQAAKVTRKAHDRDSRQALDKLAEVVDGELRIRSDPPELMPMRELAPGAPAAAVDAVVWESLKAYRQSVAPDVRVLLDKFTPVEAALKVVGVGSVGTVTAILLLVGRDDDDPMFLQVKQADRSVLESHLSRSRYSNHAHRVVEGQRLMQTASDIFLGWNRSNQTGFHYYWRQLRDWKGSADVENANAADLRYLARLCGWTLARAHARSSDPVVLAGYLGSGSVFDDALTRFAASYADQNERDYGEYTARVHRDGLAVAHEIAG